MGEVAEGAVKVRAISRRALNLDGAVRSTLRVEVDLHRLEERRRRVGVGAEDRLAADHYEFVELDDVRGSGDHVIEIRPPHLLHVPKDATALRLAEGSRKRGVLPEVIGESAVLADDASHLAHGAS
jgi:hypothetical protein